MSVEWGFEPVELAQRYRWPAPAAPPWELPAPRKSLQVPSPGQAPLLMTKTKPILVAVLLAQLAGPALKLSGWALASRSWGLATCLLWGPWLLLGVLAGLGWLLRRVLAAPANT